MTGGQATRDLPALPAEVTRGLAAQAVRVITRAEAMGLVDSAPTERLATPLLQDALRALGGAGIGRELFMTRAQITEQSLRTLNALIAMSPCPFSEWGSVSQILGPEVTADLLHVSSSSIRRYATGDRATPDHVASRLHFLAMVLADLRGSYSDVGVRRWFERPRSALGGRSPGQVLGPDWAPEDEGARQIRDLAASLVGANDQ